MKDSNKKIEDLSSEYTYLSLHGPNNNALYFIYTDWSVQGPSRVNEITPNGGGLRTSDEICDTVSYELTSQLQVSCERECKTFEFMAICHK